MTDATALPHAHGVPDITAVFRRHPEDFVVEELLGWTPTGSGEHVCLMIRKRGITTQQAMRRIAEHAGVPQRLVSHAGLKDRQGVCLQWISVHLPGRNEPDFSALDDESLVVQTQVRNSRRIRIGSHAANRFTIRLREFRDPGGHWQQRLQQVREQGVPNYFGEQRFGRDNERAVTEWFAGRSRPGGRVQRGFLLSAARALLFNRLLAWRVEEGLWDRQVPGDVMMLAGSNSHFLAEGSSEELRHRLLTMDIHPSGPLWGQGELPVREQARQLELALAEQYPLLCQGLEKQGVVQGRRSLRLAVEDCVADADPAGECLISFRLAPGTYATSVLRELCKYREEPRNQTGVEEAGSTCRHGPRAAAIDDQDRN